jgi:DNA-binding beta-propeller fold protein YncE
MNARRTLVLAVAFVQIAVLSPAVSRPVSSRQPTVGGPVKDATVKQFATRFNSTLSEVLDKLLPRLGRLTPLRDAREEIVSLSLNVAGGEVRAEGLGLLLPEPRRYDLSLEFDGITEPNPKRGSPLKVNGILQFDFITHGRNLADGLFRGVLRLGGKFRGAPEIHGEVRNGKIVALVAQSGSDTSKYGDKPSPFVTYTGTLAGGGYYERGNRDGAGSQAQFDGPTGVDVDDETGAVYVADKENDAIRRISATRQVTTLTSGLDEPVDLAFDGNGDLIVSQNSSDEAPLGRVSVDTGAVTPIIYNQTEAGDDLCGRIGGSCDGRSPIGTMQSAQGIDVHGGVIYATQANYPGSIKMVLPDGTVTTVHRVDTGGREGGDCGNAGILGGTRDVAKGLDGELYFVINVTGCYGILVLEPDGSVRTLAGNLEEYGRKDGVGAAARFFDPSGLAFDGNQYLYVADSVNSLIRRVDVYTGEVVRVAGCLDYEPGFDCFDDFGFRDGNRDRAQFYSPTGLALDEWGDIYVADRRNNAVRVVRMVQDPERAPLITGFAPFAMTRGQAATVAVTGENLGLAEGASLGAGVEVVGLTHAGDRQLVLDVEVDPLAEPGGRTLVIDTPYGSISSPPTLSFIVLGDDVPGAEVTTIAGTGTWLPAVNDGPAQNARFGFPTGIDVQDFDRLLVVDTLEQRVRLIATKDGASDELLELLLYAVGVPSVVPAILTKLSEIGQFLEGLGISAAIPNATEAILREPIAQAIAQACASVGSDCERLVMPWAGFPLQSGSKNGFRLESSFYLPTDIASAGSGQFFVADAGNSMVRTIGVNPINKTPESDPFITFGLDSLRERPFAVADGLGESALVSTPGSHQILKIELKNGGEESVFAGVQDEIGCTQTEFGHRLGVPLGMDSTQGATYVADPFCQTIWRIEDGTVYDIRGSVRLPGPALGPCSDGPAAFANFGAPIDVAVDGKGNIWFVDAMCGSVRVVRNLFNQSGVDAFEWADTISDILGLAKDHLPPQLGVEYAQLLDDLDENFITTNSWWVTTVAGSMNGEHGFVDGPAEDARFFLPIGIAVATRDDRTQVYISDAGNLRVRMLNVPGGL